MTEKEFVGVRVSVEERSRISKEADERGISIAEFLRQAVRNELDGETPQEE